MAKPKQNASKTTIMAAKKKKKVPAGYHVMPNGKLMKGKKHK
jgi:hypothetical protein